MKNSILCISTQINKTYKTIKNKNLFATFIPAILAKPNVMWYNLINKTEL